MARNSDSRSSKQQDETERYRQAAEDALQQRFLVLDPAAVGQPAPAPVRTNQRRPTPEPDELLWAYCVLSAGDAIPDGVDRVEAGGLAALVRSVPRSEEPLRRNLNDLAWLEQVARSHEAVLEQALAEDSVHAMLERERDSLRGALELLAGREDWGVKLLVDPVRLSETARAESGEPSLEGVGDGGAYMLRRRHERELASWPMPSREMLRRTSTGGSPIWRSTLSRARRRTASCPGTKAR